jgi:hypothetical protein
MSPQKLYRMQGKRPFIEGAPRIRAPKLRPIPRKGPIDGHLRHWKNYADRILKMYKLTPDLHRRLSAARRYQANVSHAVQKATIIDLTGEILRKSHRFPLRNQTIHIHTTHETCSTDNLFDDE